MTHEEALLAVAERHGLRVVGSLTGVTGGEPVMAAKQCEATPRRTLTELRRELIARRLGLLTRQLDAETVGQLGFADWCEREAAAVTRRLRMIDAARGE